MQAFSISNIFPAKAQVPVAANALSATTPTASLFAVLLQAKGKLASDTGKTPVAGRPQDSAIPQSATPSPSVPSLPLAYVPWSSIPLVQKLVIPPAGSAFDSAASDDSPARFAGVHVQDRATSSEDSGQDNIMVQVNPLQLVSMKAEVPVASLEGSSQTNGATQGAVLSSAVPQTKASSGSASEVGTDNFTNQNPADVSENLQDPISSLPILPNVLTVDPTAQTNTNNVATDPASDEPSTDVPSIELASSLPPADPTTAQDGAVGPQTNNKNALGRGAVPLNARVVQAASSDLNFLNLQSVLVPKPPVNIPTLFHSSTTRVSPPVPQLAASDDLANLPLRSPASFAEAVPGALTSTAIPVISHNFSSSFAKTLQAQGANSSHTISDGTGVSKTQAKDTSGGSEGGSQGNDTNAKSDHVPNTQVSHVDARVFTPSLVPDPANATSGTGQPVTAASNDVTMIAATTRTPGDTQPNNSNIKSNPPSEAALPTVQAMPAASTTNPLMVSGARLVDHPGQTEIRVEMQGDSLGGVELRAHISGDQINASIAVEHHDTQILLTNELPALHNALTEKDLHVNSLSVSHGMAASTGGGASGDASQRGFAQNNQKPAYSWLEELTPQTSDAPTEWMDTGSDKSGLSVLA